MSLSKRFFTAVSVILLAATFAEATNYASVKKINIEQSTTQSPFWASGPDVLDYAPAVGFFPNASTPAGGEFEPIGSPTIGDTSVTSIRTRGTFNIAGTSTSIGGWTNGNGVPVGITLEFLAEFTVSVGAGSPEGSWLTAGSSSVALGIGQPSQGGTETDVYDSIDSVNLNDIEPDFIPGDSDEYLNVSAVSVSEVEWSGSLTEPGFENHEFTGGFVGNFGTYVLRANGVTLNEETFGMFVEGAPTDPNNPDKPTLGFGGPSRFANEQAAGYGQGVVESYIPIVNGFANNNVTTEGVTNSPWYDRQVGAWRFDPYNGTIAIKGIGYEYDVNFSITDPNAALDGDFNGDDVVDSLDYVVWRMGLNGNPPEEEDYELWLANYGEPNVEGAGAGSAVPEPATVSLVLLGLLTLGAARRARKAL